MRYDYYNSRYFLTESIPLILVSIALALGYLLERGAYARLLGKAALLIIIIYFSIFSFFQLNKQEAVDLDFYEKINSKLDESSILVFINKNIYNSKYSNSFNLYVAGPIKYFYGKKILVIDSPEILLKSEVKDLLAKFPKKYYLSNIPLKDVEGFNEEEKITLKYSHFNNSPGCNLHNYEFLDIQHIKSLLMPDFLRCKLLPDAYFQRSREYYAGILNIASSTVH
jgi:hypothetical protein